MYASFLNAEALIVAVVIFTTLGAAVPAIDSTARKITWIECPTPYVSNLKCANLSVPIDWSQPEGAQVALALRMIPAKDQSQKIGSLCFNSGGPGAAVTPELNVPGGTGIFGFTDEIYEKFDMVAMDPRGIGASHLVQCSPDVFDKRITQFPQNEASFAEVLGHYKLLGASCANLTGPLINHVDSVSVARDFDAVRAAMGEDKFNYIGLSYGSLIGTAYAELFPDRIRAMVFDGNVDHTQEQTYTVLTEIRTYEKVLNLFFDWCENNSSCAVHRSHTNSTQSIPDMWDALIDRANESPIPAPECAGVCHSNVTGEDILFNAQEMLLFKDPLPGFPPNYSAPPSASSAYDWPGLGEALYQIIFENDATYLSTALTLPQNAFNASNTYAFVAVFCQDWKLTARTLPEILNLQQLALSVAPHTRGASEFWRQLVECIAWPAPVQYPQHATRISDIPPMLLVNAYYDPETAYEWAVALQSEIANSTLLTRNGAGHTSYGLRGETSKAINKYMLTLELPPPNTVYDT